MLEFYNLTIVSKCIAQLQVSLAINDKVPSYVYIDIQPKY